MHTTRHETMLGDAEPDTISPFFGCDSTLSERELLTIAPKLARPAPEGQVGGTVDTSSSVTRMLDVCVAIVILVVLLPVLILTAASIVVSNRGPVIFRQVRIGQNGRSFECFKFRTMRQDSEKILADLLAERPDLRHEWMCNQKLSEDPRITAIGSFLRQSSIDELPQLFNVIRGEMSLVGPRPIIPNEIPRYGRYIEHYMSVRPGLTGLWQVSGRNDTSYRRRVAADVLYARKASLRLDLAILLATIPAVLSAEGAR